jgi:predicted esterase
MACSGLHCADMDLMEIDIQSKKQTPVFVYHGKEDRIIPSEYAGRSYEILKNIGLNHFEF